MKIRQALELMVAEGASDLHLKVPSAPVLRIDGSLRVLRDMPPLTAEDTENVLKAVTTPAQRLKFEREPELEFAYGVQGLARFRVNVLRQRGTISLAFRLVPSSTPSIDALELPSILKTLVQKPRGLILVTGHAGSGKSTTLAAMLSHLNEQAGRLVITIEDPIEFLHADDQCVILQRDLGDDTSSFHRALMNALRHDPDVLVIGEMRDLDTISTALKAAETGHLVLGTLHTMDAAQTVDRIIDVFPPAQQQQIRFQLSQVMEAVLSQTLLPRVRGGRVAAMEIMLGTSGIRNQIRTGRVHEVPSLIHLGSKEGMQTLDQALTDLVKRGIVARNAAMERTSNPGLLLELLGGFTPIDSLREMKVGTRAG